MLNYRLNLEKCSSIFLMIDIDDPIVFLLLEDRIFLLSFQIGNGSLVLTQSFIQIREVHRIYVY